MKSLLKKILKKLFSYPFRLIFNFITVKSEKEIIAMGRLLANQIKNFTNIDSIHEVEFSIFSQFGDDGIIQWLIHKLDIPNKTFIEFGVENYSESNTRFLLMNNNWTGLVMDGSTENVEEIKKSYYYWKYSVEAKAVFVTKDNINQIIKNEDFHEDLGLLHIDIDGNDYYVWDAITAVNPVIVIMEYNSIFGYERPICIPYHADFYRLNYHYSGLYWGASLLSLCDLAEKKGYAFIGCNSNGNNAYFVRKDKMVKSIKELSIQEGFVSATNRETRNAEGKLTYQNRDKAKEVIRGMEVFNTSLKKSEEF